MYYYHQMTTDEIAAALGYSRATVSRLLNRAREEGIVEIRIIDRHNQQDPLSTKIKRRYRGLHTIEIVSVPSDSSDTERLTRVSQRAAAHISNNVVENNQVIGISSGETLTITARHLPHRALNGVQIVQLQGITAAGQTGPGYVSGILQNFAEAYDGEVVLYPVPMMFADPDARRLVWDEPTVRIAREYQSRADVLVFSVGVAHLTWERILHDAGLDQDQDYRGLLDHDVVGDLATVFYRADGSYQDLGINLRSSGPPLDTYRRVSRSVCITSGSAKVPALHAALDAGFISDLVIDNITASLLGEFER